MRASGVVQDILWARGWGFKARGHLKTLEPPRLAADFDCLVYGREWPCQHPFPHVPHYINALLHRTSHRDY